jgi:tetratricopeptide (TPR) repeat protein
MRRALFPVLISTLFALGLTACAPQKQPVKLGAPLVKPWVRSTQASEKLISRGEYDLALKKAHRALEQARDQNSESKTGDVSIVMGHIGKIHRLMYDHDRSAAYYRDALRMRRQAFGTDHRYYAQGLLGLGRAYGHQNRRKDAINTLQAALNTAARALGENNRALVPYLSSLAIVHEDNLSFDAALPLREKAVALIGSDSQSTKHQLAQAQWRAGITARDSGDTKRATAWFSQGLTHFEAAPASASSLASRLQTAAITHAKSGEYETAEKLMIRALGIREDNMQFDHPEVVDSYTVLGDIYKAMDRIDDSLRYRQYASRARNGVNPYKK